jgi:hypothetical protein
MALAYPQMFVVLSAIISWKEVSDKWALRNADELLSEFTAARATLELRLISLIGHVTILRCLLIVVRTKTETTYKTTMKIVFKKR